MQPFSNYYQLLTDFIKVTVDYVLYIALVEIGSSIYVLTAIFVVATICLQIFSIPLAYFHKKGFISSKWCVLTRRLVYILSAVLAVIFYTRLYFIAYIKAPITTVLCLVGSAFMGSCHQNQSKLVLLSLITATFTISAHLILKEPFSSASIIYHFSTWYIIISGALLVNGFKEYMDRLLENSGTLISWLLVEFDLQPKSIDVKTRQGLIQIHSLVTMTLFYTVFFWKGTLFISGLVLLIYGILNLIGLHSTKNKTPVYIFAPAQILSVCKHLCVTIGSTYNPEAFISYKFLLFTSWSMAYLFFMGATADKYQRFELEINSDKTPKTNHFMISSPKPKLQSFNGAV